MLPFAVACLINLRSNVVCAPFFRTNFFVQLAALRYELLPIIAGPRGSFIPVFGL